MSKAKAMEWEAERDAMGFEEVLSRMGRDNPSLVTCLSEDERQKVQEDALKAIKDRLVHARSIINILIDICSDCMVNVLIVVVMYADMNWKKKS
jgi:hypothetical protein